MLQGALRALQHAARTCPVGVHLAVVDPGVGSHRRPLALRTGRRSPAWSGRTTGCSLPAADTLGGVAEVHELASPSTRSTWSRGRSTAATSSRRRRRTSLGVPLDELGPPIDPQALARLDLPAPDVGQNRIRATVLYVDHFGNMQLNLKREHLEDAGVLPGVTVELELALDRYYATAARTFADARPGDIILYEDSYGNIAIAISGGSARGALRRTAAGEEVRIHLRTPVRLSDLGAELGRRFARVATNAVVVAPSSLARFPLA